MSQFAHRSAAKRGYRFGDGVEREIPRRTLDMAKRILERAANEGRSELVELDARTSEAQLDQLVDAMIEAGRSIPGYFQSRGAVIGEQTIDIALRRLCPLWPICD